LSALVVVAPAATASDTQCDQWAVTKDYQGSICLQVLGSGLYTSSITGTYDGNPLEDTMELYVDSTKVESWTFHYSDIAHRFSTGYHYHWPHAVHVHMCLPYVYAVGRPCTPPIWIHA
jgi:PKD repeat protein